MPELRQSRQVHAVINALTLWDIHWLVRLEKWRQEVGFRVRRWFDSLADLEALCSLAALTHDRPHFAFPSFISDSPAFVAEGLEHPLLDKPFHNDVQLPGPRHALIITGSNMSGKSTLLRAIGTNAVLALAGAPVCARALRTSELQVLTSMRVRDSLELGVSHFYAEAKRIKRCSTRRWRRGDAPSFSSMRSFGGRTPVSARLRPAKSAPAARDRCGRSGQHA